MSIGIFTLYKTTNTINNKIYIGIHLETSWPILDDYLGSGTALNSAINKYGKNNFKREILVVGNSLEYVYELERRYVTEDFVNESSNYNLIGGGKGPNYFGIETRKKMSDAKKGVPRSEEVKEHLRRINLGENNPFYGQKQSKVAKRKMSKAAKQRTGDRNNFYGKTHSSDAKKRIGESTRGATWKLINGKRKWFGR